MKLKVLALLAILPPLLSLTAACSKSETDTPQASNEATSIEDSNQHTEAGPGTPAADRDASSASDPLPTHKNCDLDAVTESRIRELEAKLADLQLRYTEIHPAVIAARRQLEEAKQDALSDCIERVR